MSERQDFIPRRFNRRAEEMPVTLLLEATGDETRQAAATIDYSEHGLRIQNDAPLVAGQLVYVPYFGHCRVVWVGTSKSGGTSEAGLEVLR